MAWISCHYRRIQRYVYDSLNQRKYWTIQDGMLLTSPTSGVELPQMPHEQNEPQRCFLCWICKCTTFMYPNFARPMNLTTLCASLWRLWLMQNPQHSIIVLLLASFTYTPPKLPHGQYGRNAQQRIHAKPDQVLASLVRRNGPLYFCLNLFQAAALRAHNDAKLRNESSLEFAHDFQ